MQRNRLGEIPFELNTTIITFTLKLLDIIVVLDRSV